MFQKSSRVGQADGVSVRVGKKKPGLKHAFALSWRPAQVGRPAEQILVPLPYIGEGTFMGPTEFVAAGVYPSPAGATLRLPPVPVHLGRHGVLCTGVQANSPRQELLLVTEQGLRRLRAACQAVTG